MRRHWISEDALKRWEWFTKIGWAVEAAQIERDYSFPIDQTKL